MMLDFLTPQFAQVQDAGNFGLNTVFLFSLKDGLRWRGRE